MGYRPLISVKDKNKDSILGPQSIRQNQQIWENPKMHENYYIFTVVRNDKILVQGCFAVSQTF